MKKTKYLELFAIASAIALPLVIIAIVGETIVRHNTAKPRMRQYVNRIHPGKEVIDISCTYTGGICSDKDLRCSATVDMGDGTVSHVEASCYDYDNECTPLIGGE